MTTGIVIGSLGSSGSIDTINQTGHGFHATADVGRPMRISGGNYVFAQADSDNTAEVLCLFSKYVTADQFEVALSGEVTSVTTAAFSEGVIPAVGTLFFLSASVLGKLTVTEPAVFGHVSKPLGMVSGATALYFFNMRGSVVGGANAQTSISIANNATSTIQDVSAYTGGRIEGDIILAATTSLKAHFNIEFVKNGAGNYVASASYTGDNTTVVISCTNAGLIQATLGSVAGYSSCVFNYSLNAPAVGATFPLSISAGLVLGRTDGAAVPAGYIGEVIPFTGRTTTGSSGSWVANATPLATLTPGLWSLRGWMYFTATGSANIIVAAISSNATANNSNQLALTQVVYTANAAAANVAFMPLAELALQSVSVNTPLYAKSLSEDAAVDVSLGGFAVRVG